MLAVLDAVQIEGARSSCSHREKTWKPPHCQNGAGRSRPSPAISSETARRSAPISMASASRWRHHGRRSLAEYEVYIRARFVDDPHLWATSLFVEVVAL